MTNFSSEKRYDKKIKNKENPTKFNSIDGINIPMTINMNVYKNKSNKKISFFHENNDTEEYFWDLDKGEVNEEEFNQNIVTYDY